MSALFNDVHNTNTTDVKLSELVGRPVTGRMLDAFQRHTSTSYDVDDMPDTTEDGTPIPEHAFERAEDMTFDPWIS